jgi:hypothetical protein
MNVTEWINRTSMTSLAGLVLQCVWLVGSLGLTFACVSLLLMTPGDYFKTVPIAADPQKLKDFMALYLSLANSAVQTSHSTGLYLAGILVAAWTGIKVVNTVQHGKDRTTAREFVAAQEEGKIAGTARALALADVAREHHAAQPVVSVEHADEVVAEARAGRPATVNALPTEREPEWSTGDPRGGVL